MVQVQAKRAVAGIEHERLSTRVLTTMRNGYVMRLIPPVGPEFCIGSVNSVDIPVDVAMLLRFLAAAKRGHLNQVFHIFADLLEMVQ